MSRPLNILMIEDDAGDAALIERQLSRGGIVARVVRVDRADELTAALAQDDWDVAISDYHLPGFDALSALAIVRRMRGDLPFIVVSGLIGEERAVEVMRAGAQDFVTKDRLARIVPAIERELIEAARHREQRLLDAAVMGQKRRFKLALEAVGDGVWDINPRTGVATYSDEWKRMLGYAPGEFGDSVGEWLAHIHPDDLAQVKRNESDHFTGKTANYRSEYRLRCKDGSWKWVLDRGVVIERDAGGHPLREIGTMTDISESRHNESALRLLQVAVNQINDTIIITEAEPLDRPGPRIVFVNSAFESKTGYSADEALGHSPRMLQGADTDPESLRRLGAALRASQPIRIELLNYTKSGEKFWAELDITPVADARGHFTHMVSVQRDVTERKRAETERERMIHELETRNRELDTYNHSVAHDLRNPVISIHGMADLAEIAIDAGNLNRARDCVQRIARSATQADALIKSLMTLAKLGKRALNRRPWPVVDLVRELLSTLNFQIVSANAAVILDCDEQLHVLADLPVFQIMLGNLVSNALKHRHPARTPQVRISATPTAQPSGVEIRVLDNGLGIDQLAHARVFQLFERVNDGADGTGVGLALVDRAARMHRGHASLLDSRPGLGSCFALWLPSDLPGEAHGE